MLNASTGNVITLAKEAIIGAELRPLFGVVTNVLGPIVRANLATAQIGQIYELVPGQGAAEIKARVIALDGSTAILSPFSDCSGLAAGCIVRKLSDDILVPGGSAMLGRVLDGLGAPIDELGPAPSEACWVPARATAPDPMSRSLISNVLETGLKVIDAAMTIGKGQRVGIFGPPGTGKTSLLAALAQHTDVDAIVIGMIGERGREVREFLERHLPEEKRGKIVVVVATSDRAAMERVYAAHTATAVAETMRDEGKSVLLLIDSLTRVARALREVGLAAGEQPTRRGYPASVFPALPELIERAGGNGKGEITAMYTVLVEGDGTGDPIAEETKSLTDGHIILSQAVAESGRYPAIDVAQSLSRVMNDIANEDQLKMNVEMRALLAKFLEIEMLVQIGEYKTGSDKRGDDALRAVPKLNTFFSQKTSERVSYDIMLQRLRAALK